MTAPGTLPGDALGGFGGIAAWGAADSEVWKASLSNGIGASGVKIADYSLEILQKLGQFLADVASGIASGLVAAGGWVVGIITDIGDMIGALVGNLAAAVLGLPASAAAGLTGAGAFEAIADGQRELNEQVALLDDVSGFANATMGSAWSFGGNWASSTGQVMPFFDRIGPEKNAHVEGNGGIYFTGAGTWRVDAQLTAQGIGSGAARLRIEILVQRKLKTASPGSGGTAWSKKTFYEEVPGFHRSYAFSHNVIVPPDEYDYWVLLRAWHNRSGSVTFPRGDQYQALSVNRWDLRTDGPGNMPIQPDLPDT